jgi:TonB family protein
VRVFRPGFVVFCAALLASLSVHLPVYEVLGVLAKALLTEPAAQPAQPVEFELAALGETDKPEQPSDQPQDDAAHPPTPSSRPEPAPKAPPEPKPAPAQEPKRRVDLNVVPPPPPPPPPVPALAPPPADAPNKLAVTQRSDDPNVAPPDHADFVAEENRRVEEQTIASITNLHEDSPEPSPAPSSAPNADAPGDSETDAPADLQDVHGDASRLPNAREAAVEPVETAHAAHGHEHAPAVTSAPSEGGAPGATQEAHALEAGSDVVGGEETPLIIEDGMGTLRIRRSLAGRGPGDAGGMTRRGAHNDRDAAARGARRGQGANLQLSWSQFEQTFGHEELREQRDAYLEQTRSKSRGENREVQWKKFRAAIENFVPNVKPGNQTALNAAASPFAAYLAEVHRRIHREFAMRFIRDLPLVGGPYNDHSLFTKLEIVINRDGTLHKVGIVQSSGFTPYDFGAWNAVERAAPYPEPPRKILSGDGRVYFRWGFYRNERQCGTFNAEPYILPNIGAPPSPAPGPMHDRGDADDSKLGAAPRARDAHDAHAAALARP